MRVTLEFKKTTFAAALDALRAHTGVPIEVDEAAKKAVDFEKATLGIFASEFISPLYEVPPGSIG